MLYFDIDFVHFFEVVLYYCFDVVSLVKFDRDFETFIDFVWCSKC
jgi:hypothetical protein